MWVVFAEFSENENFCEAILNPDLYSEEKKKKHRNKRKIEWTCVSGKVLLVFLVFTVMVEILRVSRDIGGLNKEDWENLVIYKQWDLSE